MYCRVYMIGCWICWQIVRTRLVGVAKCSLMVRRGRQTTRQWLHMLFRWTDFSLIWCSITKVNTNESISSLFHFSIVLWCPFLGTFLFHYEVAIKQSSRQNKDTKTTHLPKCYLYIPLSIKHHVSRFSLCLAWFSIIVSPYLHPGWCCDGNTECEGKSRVFCSSQTPRSHDPGPEEGESWKGYWNSRSLPMCRHQS